MIGRPGTGPALILELAGGRRRFRTAPHRARVASIGLALLAILPGAPGPGQAQATTPAAPDPVEVCRSATPTIVGSGTISGTDGDDVIFGGSDDDVIDAGDGNDIVCGGGGNDTISGGAGDDLIDGGIGRDTIDGGDGDDVIDGGEGRDTISGGPGNDLIRGGQSGDLLDGGEGDDFLSGDADNDTLIGSDGFDVCDGGTGRDVEDPSCELILAQMLGPAEAAPEELASTHGVASGEVGAREAVVWARANRPGRMEVEVDADPSFSRPIVRQAEATAESDFTAQARLDGLEPGTPYTYGVRFTTVGEDGQPTSTDPVVGRFRTAPDPSATRPVAFVFGGNLGGQHYCRRVDLGYPIFAAMQALDPDFFVAAGDMILADWDCPAEGPREVPDWQNVSGTFPAIDNRGIDWTDPALVREVYLRHWRYNRADPVLQEFLRRTPMYAQWDDHDVLNDFGADWSHWTSDTVEREGYSNLVAAGREAFLIYAPMGRRPDDPGRLYRSVNWGRDLDLVLLDVRSYRSRNDLADRAENGKTMLGSEQLAWLKRELVASRATWKVVSSIVPLSVPSGTSAGSSGRDGWANGVDPNYSAETGFERELLDLLRFLDERNVRNVVFLVSDLYAQHTRHRLDLDGDGDLLLFHQLLVGPLSGRREDPRELDPTLRPTLLYAEGGLFNFGYARLEPRAGEQAHFVVDVRGEDGQPRPGSLLDLAPE